MWKIHLRNIKHRRGFGISIVSELPALPKLVLLCWNRAFRIAGGFAQLRARDSLKLISQIPRFALVSVAVEASAESSGQWPP